MAQSRTALLASALAAATLLLAGWTVYEVRQQKLAIERGLLAQAEVLAGALGPGLSAASNAAREIEEIIVWKLLDNARLLAEYPVADLGGSDRIERIAENNGLDWVAYLDAEGREILAFGTQPMPATAYSLDDLHDVLVGSSDAVILDPVIEEGIELLTVAVGRPQGGAVLVRVEALNAQTFVKSVGVENLLERLAGSAAVLYLAYDENPDGVRFAASWDDGPIPEAPAQTADSLRRIRDREVYEASVPLDSPAGRTAHLRVGLDGAPLRSAAVSAARRSFLVGTVLAAFGLAAAAVALVTRSRSREREQAAKRLAEAEAGRRRSERLAAAGALAAGLAHEVRSPMNAIGIAAQRLQRKLPEGDSRSIAATIGSEVARLEGVLREFLELARPDSGDRDLSDLDALCRDVVELLGPEAQALGVGLDLKLGNAAAPIREESIRRAVINLTRNALQASRRGDRVEVGTRSDRDAAEIVVADRGPGIDPLLRDRIFDAFVSGRASGTGLGLALVRRAADEHDGTIALENRPGGGARATLRLPRK